MLYYFLYDTSGHPDKYAVFSENFTHNMKWSTWKSASYHVYESEEGFIYRYLRDYPEFVVVAIYDYPILPSEIMQLHPEYFL